ncbi:MAG: hypothetical protein K0Q83_2522 [Deltaproteobacteria bacterium]|jgi:hypothetical protein|nr:hypothetical protein [Deltaproteobacteria bacterium]
MIETAAKKLWSKTGEDLLMISATMIFTVGLYFLFAYLFLNIW